MQRILHLVNILKIFKEFEVSGLTQIDSQIVRPPRVAESPVNMECKLERIVELGRKVILMALGIGEGFFCFTLMMMLF
ncbi:MAG: hypothetical protein CM1200mP38_2350 [Dehalococcoidia bacterium]|nr:MAG: hypothetical protein CM1200mP38_2350 [Dehalococcoidia bacterium]